MATHSRSDISRVRMEEESSVKEDTGLCFICCGLPRKYLSFMVSVLELMVSLGFAIYTAFGISHYPDYNAEVIFHDELFVEARRHSPAGKFSNVPLGLLYCDLSLFIFEFALALLLLYGLAKNEISAIRFWMSSMIAYNVVLTGIFLGFVVGGISSSRLNLMGFFHAFFRFFEIALVYSYYEHLCHKEKLARIERENNNGVPSRELTQLAYLPTDYGTETIEPVRLILPADMNDGFIEV